MFKKTILALSLALFVFAASAVVADAANDDGVTKLKTNLKTIGTKTGLGTGTGEDANLPEKIAGIVNIVLGFVGLLSTIIIIYAGFRWMTASGNEEQVKEARGNIRNAVIGIVVILLSYAIINFVVNRVSEETGAGGGGGGGTQAGVGACIYVDDDNTHGDSGTCATFTTCSDAKTYTACQDLKGREYKANRPDADCQPWFFKPNETCADNGF